MLSSASGPKPVVDVIGEMIDAYKHERDLSAKRGRVPEYLCARRRYNSLCENAFRISVAEMDEMILQSIEEHALTPQAIEGVIQLSEQEEALLRVRCERMSGHGCADLPGPPFAQV